MPFSFFFAFVFPNQALISVKNKKKLKNGDQLHLMNAYLLRKFLHAKCKETKIKNSYIEINGSQKNKMQKTKIE